MLGTERQAEGNLQGFQPAKSFRAAPVVTYQESALNMPHWLHSLLPHIPHYGYVLVFIVVFLNHIGIPLPANDSLF
jgi:hypothetical protein